MKPRPTDAEFDELKRKRDESLAAVFKKIWDDAGVPEDQRRAHVSYGGGSHACYCDCPDGPCQHIWDGPDKEFDDGHGVSCTCSRCGALAFYHDMRVLP